MAAKDDLGRHGEDLAVHHLEAAGLDVVDRNWRCRQGEIDIVARDGPDIAFVEVKTRTGHEFGHPLEAITARKLARLRRLAGEWCAAHPEARGSIRIDAVAVTVPRRVDRDRVPTAIEHLRGIF